ncbi:MAG: hypothetical protein HFG45_09935 [Oscillospiraceae bacterium]|nr:hypothetical protein [Oscillospiraceae bacterium]
MVAMPEMDRKFKTQYTAVLAAALADIPLLVLAAAAVEAVPGFHPVLPQLVTVVLALALVLVVMAAAAVLL